MKKIQLLILLLSIAGFLNSQEAEPCSGFYSDSQYYRYTARGSQIIINGDHSKAINESRRIARITAESELASMINSAITRVIEYMTINDSQEMLEFVSDTSRVSSLQYFEGMKTICESEPELVGNCYVIYLTKEISVNCIGDSFFKMSPKSKNNVDYRETKSSFIELLGKDNFDKTNKE